jgi:hypothetical protein
LNWGQGGLTIQKMMGIWGICPNTFESDCRLGHTRVFYRSHNKTGLFGRYIYEIISFGIL